MQRQSSFYLLKTQYPEYFIADFHEEFTKGNVIGKGGEGKVVLVKRKADNKEFAAKYINISGKKSEDNSVREVITILSVSHPNIIKIHGFSFINDEEKCKHQLIILMDYIIGERLDVWIKKVQTIDEKVEAIYQVVLAIEELHSHGIIHRDIKFDNILMNGNTPILIDFGTSFFQNVAVNTLLRFSDGWNDPDIINSYFPSTYHDVYSIGILIQKTLGDDFSALAKACQNQNHHLRPSVSQIAKEIALRNPKLNAINRRISCQRLFGISNINDSNYDDEKVTKIIENLSKENDIKKSAINLLLLQAIGENNSELILSHPEIKNYLNFEGVCLRPSMALLVMLFRSEDEIISFDEVFQIVEVQKDKYPLATIHLLSLFIKTRPYLGTIKNCLRIAAIKSSNKEFNIYRDRFCSQLILKQTATTDLAFIIKYPSILNIISLEEDNQLVKSFVNRLVDSDSQIQDKTEICNVEDEFFGTIIEIGDLSKNLIKFFIFRTDILKKFTPCLVRRLNDECKMTADFQAVMNFYLIKLSNLNKEFHLEFSRELCRDENKKLREFIIKCRNQEADCYKIIFKFTQKIVPIAEEWKE